MKSSNVSSAISLGVIDVAISSDDDNCIVQDDSEETTVSGRKKST